MPEFGASIRHFNRLRSIWVQEPTDQMIGAAMPVIGIDTSGKAIELIDSLECEPHLILQSTKAHPGCI